MLTDKRVADWEQMLRGRTMLDAANELAASVVDVRVADAETCWAVIWNKPLYANTYVALGEGMSQRLSPWMPEAWRSWGTRDGPLSVEYQGGNNRADNFRLSGTLSAKQELRIAPHRLLAIQGAAIAFRQIVIENGAEAPLASWASQPLDQLIPSIKRRFGRGWGHITILHMLTDLGLAVKPDLHLVRTVRALGWMSDLPEVAVPSLQDAVRINRVVLDRAKEHFGDQFGPAKLRYLDKLLMEVSRQGLLNLEQGRSN